MEADWSVEVGAEMPVLDPLWPGLIDLLSEPDRVLEIAEAARFPALAQALLRIHGEPNPRQGTASSQSAQPAAFAFWTAKCDLWEPDENDEPWDPDEMDAPSHQAQAAIACYVDLLPRSLPSPGSPSSTRQLFLAWHDAEQTAKILALAMRHHPLACSRADFIVRSALTPTHQGFGITVYLAACGTDPSTAASTLTSALEALGQTLTSQPPADFRANRIPLQ